MDNTNDAMLSGLRNTGPSLFENLSPMLEPDPDEMEKQREAALYHKHVEIKSFNVKTFDMIDQKKSNAYAKLMRELYHGSQRQTHSIIFNDRRFVEQPEPRWVAHIEWVEFELIKESNPTTGDKDG